VISPGAFITIDPHPPAAPVRSRRADHAPPGTNHGKVPPMGKGNKVRKKEVKKPKQDKKSAAAKK